MVKYFFFFHKIQIQFFPLFHPSAMAKSFVHNVFVSFCSSWSLCLFTVVMCANEYYPNFIFLLVLLQSLSFNIVFSLIFFFVISVSHNILPYSFLMDFWKNIIFNMHIVCVQTNTFTMCFKKNIYFIFSCCSSI